MRQATFVWSFWQALVAPFLNAFTRQGHRRFVDWGTALALNVEEHTVTQSVVAIERRVATSRTSPPARRSRRLACCRVVAS